MTHEPLDALDAARIWELVLDVVTDEIPVIAPAKCEVRMRVFEGVPAVTVESHEEFAVSQELWKRLCVALGSEAPDRGALMLRALERAGFAIVRVR